MDTLIYINNSEVPSTLTNFIEIQVVCIAGGRKFLIQVKETDSILSIKAQLQQTEIAVPSHQQRLFFNSKELEDHETIQNLNIQNGDSLTIQLKVNYEPTEVLQEVQEPLQCSDTDMVAYLMNHARMIQIRNYHLTASDDNSGSSKFSFLELIGIFFVLAGLIAVISGSLLRSWIILTIGGGLCVIGALVTCSVTS